MTTVLDRPARSDALEVAHDEVHIWWAWLDAPEWRVRQLAATLDAEELARAGRFYAQQHCARWIVGRGLLRELLGTYIGCLPSSLRLVYGAHGKPALADDWRTGNLRFNVAHSDGLGVFALTCGREVGVDVEAIRPLKDLELIAEQFFSPRERATLGALRADQQVDSFFNCWSRKEAYIKALGLGLSQPLDTFDVELAPGRPARLLAVDGCAVRAADWCLQALAAPPGFAAAVVVPGQINRITRRWVETP